MKGEIKLRLKSRRLGSGRFQVNFSTQGMGQEYYGYLLTEPQTPLREVVEKIGRHVDAARSEDRYFQRNLFSMQRPQVNSGRILIFKTQAHAIH